jgi:hypothetical protein
MFTGQLPKILISCLLGFAIGSLDLCGMFLTVKYFCAGKKGNKIFVAFFASEMIRLSLVLGALFCLSFIKSLSFGWLVLGPLLFTLVKFVFAYSQIKKL